MSNRKKDSFFSSIIEYTDLFGQIPSFRVLKKEKMKSSLGFFMTIIVMVMTLSYLLTEIISMIEKSQPSMIASEELIFDTSAFSLNNDNFTLAISVSDMNANAIEGMNKVRIEDPITGNITIQLNCIDVPYETCNKSHFTTDLQQNYFKRIKFGSLQCINRKYLKDTPPVLQGQQNSMLYQFLVIHLSMCKNTTESQTCASEEEIIKKLQSAQYNIYSSDYLLQLARAKEPLEQIITPYFVSFSTSTSKKIIQYYEIIQTETDNGLLFEELKVQANLKKGSFEPYSELYNGKYLIQHCLAIQSVQINYFRSYIKLQTILAKIGGIWQIFVMVFTFLFKGLLNDLLLLKISGKLFNFAEQSQIDKKQSYDKSTDSVLYLNQNFTNSFVESIRIILGCDSKKKQQFKKAKFKILKSLDIVDILKKQQRIQNFISMFLNEQQYKALSVISKPYIIYSNNDLYQKYEKKKNKLQSTLSECLRNEKNVHVSKLLKDLKESEVQGLEKQINEKLIDQIELNFLNVNSELQSPKSGKNSELRVMDILDDIMEPKIQQLR